MSHCSRGPLLAYHIDLKRAMWRLDYLADFVLRLRGWGFNAVLLEIEDKFRFSGHPALAHPDAPSHEEWRAWAQACESAGIEVIPLVQSLGHFEFVTARSEYASLREAPDLAGHLDPTNPAALPLVRGLIDEVVDVFQPRRYFHIGGDETQQLGRSSRLKRFGMDALYLQQIVPLLRHVVRRGLRPLLWHDMGVSLPKTLQKIPRTTLMVDWDYQITGPRSSTLHVWGGHDGTRVNPLVTWGPDYERVASPTFRRTLGRFAEDAQTRRDGSFRGFFCTDALRAHGFGVVTASANRSAGDQMGVPDFGRHHANCFWSARKGLSEGAGHIVTSWAVRHNHPETGHPATFAAILAARGMEGFDSGAICREWAIETFGVALPDFAQAIDLASRGLRPAKNRDRVYGRAGTWSKRLRALQGGEDLLEADIRSLCAEHGGLAKTRAQIARARREFARAVLLFRRCRRQAKRNAHLLEFWLEGVALQDFYLDFLQAAMARRLPREAVRLDRRARGLMADTRELFARTYPVFSVEQEVQARYGYHLEYLGRILALRKAGSAGSKSGTRK
ncbi:MAG: family 20 glycosylhydrolase [Verrucomicrobiota bacterium]